MRRILHVIAFGLIILTAPASRATEDTPEKPTPPTEASSLEPAPGGGDMLILGPQHRHVLHGAVGADGRAEIDCDQEPTAAPNREAR